MLLLTEPSTFPQIFPFQFLASPFFFPWYIPVAVWIVSFPIAVYDSRCSFNPTARPPISQYTTNSVIYVNQPHTSFLVSKSTHKIEFILQKFNL